MVTTRKVSGLPTEVSILTSSEVAAYLRIPESTVYKLAQEKKIPACKVGKHWRFVKEELHDWLVNNGRRNSAHMEG